MIEAAWKRLEIETAIGVEGEIVSTTDQKYWRLEFRPLTATQPATQGETSKADEVGGSAAAEPVWE